MSLSREVAFIATLYAPWLRAMTAENKAHCDVATALIERLEEFASDVERLETRAANAVPGGITSKLEAIGRLADEMSANLDRPSDIATTIAKAKALSAVIAQPAPAGNVVAFTPRGGDAA